MFTYKTLTCSISVIIQCSKLFRFQCSTLNTQSLSQFDKWWTQMYFGQKDTIHKIWFLCLKKTKKSSVPCVLFFSFEICFCFYYLFPKDELWLFKSREESPSSIKMRNIWERCSFTGANEVHSRRHERPDYTYTVKAADGSCQPQGRREEGARREEWQTAALTSVAYQFRQTITRSVGISLVGLLFLQRLSALRKPRLGIVAACSGDGPRSVSCPDRTVTPQPTTKLRRKTPVMRSSCWCPIFSS